MQVEKLKLKRGGSMVKLALAYSGLLLTLQLYISNRSICPYRLASVLPINQSSPLDPVSLLLRARLAEKKCLASAIFAWLATEPCVFRIATFLALACP